MIIGLSGYARSGKDTVAGILMGLHKYDNRSFANPMREILYKLNPIISSFDGSDMDIRIKDTVDALGWDKAKVNAPEIRRLLQVFGTEIGRNMIDENIWVNMAFKGIDFGDRIVFTDVRYPNEAQRVKEYYGEVWRIERLGVKAVNTHISESSMDNWQFDRVIQNKGSIEDLIGEVKLALGSFNDF